MDRESLLKRALKIQYGNAKNKVLKTIEGAGKILQLPQAAMTASLVETNPAIRARYVGATGRTDVGLQDLFSKNHDDLKPSTIINSDSPVVNFIVDIVADPMTYTGIGVAGNAIKNAYNGSKGLSMVNRAANVGKEVGKQVFEVTTGVPIKIPRNKTVQKIIDNVSLKSERKSTGERLLESGMPEHVEKKLTKQLSEDFINSVKNISKNTVVDQRFDNKFSTTSFRRYYEQLGYDTSVLTDDQIKKVLTNQYMTLTHGQTGKLKGEILYHASPKSPEYFDWKNHLGETSGDIGVHGSGTYFSDSPNIFGLHPQGHPMRIGHIRGTTQPFLINDITEVIPSSYEVKIPNYNIGNHMDNIKQTNLMMQNPEHTVVIGRSTIDNKGFEVVTQKNKGIKSLFPHPDTANGKRFNRSWKDKRINYVLAPIGLGTYIFKNNENNKK